MSKESKKKKYPAGYIVHWASGPVYACKEHAEQIKMLGNFMGGHTHVELNLDLSKECGNCVNENKGGEQ